MSKIPFNRRLGLESTRPIGDDFPESAKVAFGYLLQDLVDQQFIVSWQAIIAELLRTGRKAHFDPNNFETDLDDAHYLVGELSWEQVYILCERIYDRLLSAVGYLDDSGQLIGSELVVPPDTEAAWIESISLSEVREYYSDEINNILLEENLAYNFIDGEFQRRGRALTQRNVQKAGLILGDPALDRVRKHFNKARAFFNIRPEPDAENCVKEALCALEASLEILSNQKSSKDFNKLVRRLQGNALREIPGPIADGMIKLHAYRGSGQGVAHAATSGTKVSELEAELVLSMVGAYITYLYDLLQPPEDEIPF